MKKTTLLAALFAIAAPAAFGQAQPTPSPTPKPELPALLSPRDFSFGFFPSGWRNLSETSPDLLAIETGYFGFVLDVKDIARPRFGLLDDNKNYASALAEGMRRLGNLPPAELEVEVKVDGKIYRANACRAGARKDFQRMSDVRLWESARFVQHYDLEDVRFADEEGHPLGVLAGLDFLAWPGSLTFTANLSPAPVFQDGPVPGVQGAGVCVEKTPVAIAGKNIPDTESFSAECWFKISEHTLYPNGWFYILGRNGHINQDGFFGLTLQNDRAGVVLNIGGGRENRRWLHGNSTFTKNTWHHLAITYDGQTLSLFVDGKPQAGEAVAKLRVPGGGDLILGMDAGSSIFQAHRAYDQIRLWSRALASEEIAAHAANPAAMPSIEGLVFEENFNALAVDEKPPLWKDAEVSIRFKGAGREWKAAQAFPGEWKEGEKKSLSLNCDVRDNRPPLKDATVRIPSHDLPVAFEPAVNAFVARTNQNLKRPWNRTAPEASELRNYDEFLIEVENAGAEAGAVPFLLYFKNPPSAPGCVATLCLPDGTPTGAPVQISKNWHLGCYLCAYMYLPAPAGKSTFLLRISYGFYGTVPQASHSQLSLVGYGGNGRWDQAAIGGWGETQCLDMDNSLTEVLITDNRGMLIRNGKDGPPWSWCEAGWGGDWLQVKDAAGQKIFFRGLKTAYTAHGPCLSELEYRGHYGSANEVEIQSIVHSPRSDDYVRTLYEQAYTFKATLPAKDAYFFKMGGSHWLATPRVAYGNREGLIAELPAPAGAKPGDLLVDRLELEGEGPWWIAYPDAEVQLPPGREKFGIASRALIIRSFRGNFSSQEYKKPTISLQVHEVQADGKLDIDAFVVPPKDVVEFKPGDRLEMDTEWLCVPRNADDYHGPNEALRQHLAESPRSWKTIHREALGNDLQATAEGATILRRYPLLARAEKPLSWAEKLLRKLQGYSASLAGIEVPAFLKSDAPPEITLAIQGGVGFAPVRFEGLKSIEGYKLYEKTGDKLVPLDQSVHGNDFWQTDFNPADQTYSLTYNLPLDGKPSSTWVLKKAP
ncbi:MAG: LamG domain-containing protein [Spartobacteria bacterium]